MFRLAVFRHRLRAEYLDSAPCPVASQIPEMSCRGAGAALRSFASAAYGASPTVETRFSRGRRRRLILWGRSENAREARISTLPVQLAGATKLGGLPSKLRLNKYSTHPML